MTYEELSDLTRSIATGAGVRRNALGQPFDVSWFQLQGVVRAAVEHGRRMARENAAKEISHDMA